MLLCDYLSNNLLRMKNKLYLILFIVMAAVCLSFSACSSDDNDSLPSIETVDIYGKTVPYAPMEEQGFPEWLRQLKNDKKMIGLHSISVGTLNDEVVYLLDVWTDSYIGGRLYDKDGNFISIGLNDLMAKVYNLRCIYFINI